MFLQKFEQIPIHLNIRIQENANGSNPTQKITAKDSNNVPININKDISSLFDRREMIFDRR